MSTSPTPRRRLSASPPLSHAEAVAQMKAATASSPPLPPPAARPSSPPLSKRGLSDPILRNALRYTISAREYSALHRYLLSRSSMLARTAPTPARVEQIVGTDSPARQRDCMAGKGLVDARDEEDQREENDYNARAVRHSMRVFILTGVAMKLWDMVLRKISKKQHRSASSQKQPLYKSPTLRLSVSLSTILLLYRLLFRFLTRLRGHLLDPSAAPFRLRNPRAAAALTSPYAPAVGASFAGLMLGVSPARHMRTSIALYAIFRALEFAWNLLESDGMIWGFKTLAGGLSVKRERPWWFGSWLTQPLVYGQLLHAVVFDRDCTPMGYVDYIMKQSSTYLQPRPEGYGIGLPWPSTYEIVDSLANMAKLNWPTYVSPTLFPKKNALPPSLANIGPLTAHAHPLIKSLSCATLHPHDPSCMRTYLTFWLQSFPPIAKTLIAVYSAMSLLPNFRRSMSDTPLRILTTAVVRALKLSTVATGAISSAWASICFFQTWLPRTLLVRQRFFLGGFVAGLWSFLARGSPGSSSSRSLFLSTARMSVDSFWKVGVKRRWWKGMRGGDVWLFVLALMVSSVVYEKDAQAVREDTWRKGISWVRGEGFKDWGIQLTEEEERMREEEEATRRLGDF
ncbi:hypothetical protein TD95_000913 [Thielaviopsis punctulata]|uniref:Uncharacterized protein n=1 Tax=Thielaviopsis punctulata TaxID=72032 RepID=A0A0F4ZFR1_9PEZI|nr:hypothetical protein TD95_000913 [Thielaviopsis punctulata]